MAKLPLIMIAALLAPAAANAPDAQQQDYPAICAAGAGWVDDDAGQVARTFEEAFATFDRQFMTFSPRFTQSVGTEGRTPGENEESALRESAKTLQLALGRLLPSEEPDNTGGPLAFSLDQLSGGNRSADREEVLRAAFVREMDRVSTPGQGGGIGRFPALLEMTTDLLDRGISAAGDEGDAGALAMLAGGMLADSYEADFRRPALRVLNEGWHTSLASRLHWHIRSMCEERDR